MNKYITRITAILSLPLCACCKYCEDTSIPRPPNPPAMRASILKGEKIRPELKTETGSDSTHGKFIVPTFKAGNKSLCLRRTNGKLTYENANCPSIYIDGKCYATFQFWGSNKNGFGYPFADIKDNPFTVQVDEKNSVYTYKKPYLDNDNKVCTFTMTIKVLSDAKLELSWDTGSKFGAAPWIHFSDYRGKMLSFGDKPVNQNSREAFAARKSISENVEGNVNFNGGSPLSSFKILWENGDSKGSMTEYYTFRDKRDIYSSTYRSEYAKKGKDNTKGKLLIDLGECAKGKNTPPQIGGMDFWDFDLTHVPQSPTKNIMTNSGFEQGVKFWKHKNDGTPWKPEYLPAGEIVSDAHTGKKAMRVNGRGALISLPIVLDADKNYVISAYVKSAVNRDNGCHLALQNASKTGGHYKGLWGRGDTNDPDSRFTAKPNKWTRIHRKLKGDAAGICVCLHGNGVIFDDIQIEEVSTPDAAPSEYVASPIDGNFVTSEKYNDVSFGQKIDAAMEFFGKPAQKGKVKVSIKNIYYENLFEAEYDVELDANGFAKLPINLDEKKLGQGIFCVRTDYDVKGFPKYTNYHRFSVMKKLENKHATKNIFGTGMFTGHHFDIDFIGRRFMQWGFGSGSWHNPVTGPNYKKRIYENRFETEILIKYRYANMLFNTHTQYSRESVLPKMSEYPYYTDWDKITPEMEKLIEEEAFITVSNYPKEMLISVAFGNEEEGYAAGKYDEYVKAQYAVYKGAKRANPNVLVAPSNGTSGYNVYRGRDAIDGYMQAANKRGFKYDAIAIHPYSNYDYDPVWDFDENIAYLISRMKHYGYPDSTPIFCTEGGNLCDAQIPPWNTFWYDQYSAGKVSYDFGNQEILQACLYARNCLAGLKYWPKMQSINHWTYEPFLDIDLTPTLWCKSVNTLGNLYGDVKFVEDIRPSAKIRSYVFDKPDKTAIAALWCTDLETLKGRTQSPIIRIKFKCPVEFIDFCGNPRRVTKDKDGMTVFHVTPMPLSIIAADSKLLAESLRDAEVEDTSSDIGVTFAPDLNGTIIANVSNHTGRGKTGKLRVGEKEFAYKLDAKQKASINVSPSSNKPEFGKIYSWTNMFKIIPERGEEIGDIWKSSYFFIPETKGKPDWSKVKALPMNNRLYEPDDKLRKNEPKDNSAVYKMAWDSENLYLRVEIKDKQIITLPKDWENPKANNNLYWFDCSLNVCFDIANDGRKNRAYDTNDYVYHFAPTKDNRDGRGHVWRWHDVDQQLADGISHATQKEVGEKVVCEFKRTQDGCVYEITFAKRYIAPLKLAEGTPCGFGIFLHDRDRDADGKVVYSGISNSTEDGTHIDEAPQFWPQMILSK